MKSPLISYVGADRTDLIGIKEKKNWLFLEIRNKREIKFGYIFHLKQYNYTTAAFFKPDRQIVHLQFGSWRVSEKKM